MKTFVIGGYIPHGGTYMAYHIGRILHEQAASECIMVMIRNETRGNTVFDYPYDFEMIDLQQLPAAVSQEDIIIVNPSFSPLLIGLRLLGRKLMYVQDFKPYAVIDGFCDHYVSVSGCVQNFLKLVYGMDTPVIPPFIRQDLIPAMKPWENRPPNSVFAVGKLYFQEFLGKFADIIRHRHPGVRFDLHANKQQRQVPHTELLRQMTNSRFLLSLSACEGFGLQPLEGMACGCTVVAFHGCGGRDFMQHGNNCLCTGYPDFDALADQLAEILADSDHASRLAAQGQLDAGQYSITIFEQHWIEFLGRSNLL